MSFKPIEEVRTGGKYYSPNSKTPVKVVGKFNYAHNCEVQFIAFMNTKPTYDKPAGKMWVLEESLFLRLYLEKN